MSQGERVRSPGYRRNYSPRREQRSYQRSPSLQKRRVNGQRRQYLDRQNDRQRNNYRTQPHNGQRYQTPKSRKLFISNIDGKIPSEEVKQGLLRQFDYFGPIIQTIVKTKLNSTNTYAFIEYQSQRHATDALKEMNGKIFKGQYLRVQYSKGQKREKRHYQYQRPKQRYQRNEYIRQRSPQPRERSKQRMERRRYDQKKHRRSFSPEYFPVRRDRSRSRQKHRDNYKYPIENKYSNYRPPRASPPYDQFHQRRRSISPDHYDRKQSRSRRKSPQYYDRRRY